MAAAGNAFVDNDWTPNYPSGYGLPNIIPVASMTHRDNLSSFSNLGRHTVHLAAPGSYIRSTFSDDAYEAISGTLMAAPHVTGVAALIKAKKLKSSWQEIRNLLLAGAEANDYVGATVGRPVDRQLQPREGDCGALVL